MNLFGKKKQTDIPVMHYEGLADFSKDYPCRIELTKEAFIIKRIKPETTVTLQLDRIKSFSAMKEENFMIAYHGQKTTTAKSGEKYYLVVNYISKEGEDKYLAFWGTAFEYSKFLDFQHMSLPSNHDYTL